MDDEKRLANKIASGLIALVLGVGTIKCGGDEKEKTETCYKQDACCAVYHGECHESYCDSDETCKCSKPEGADDYQCNCSCVRTGPREPIDKGI